MNWTLQFFDIKNNFSQFYDEYFVYWEKDWNRKKELIWTDLYKILWNKNAWLQYYQTVNNQVLIFNINQNNVWYISFRNSDWIIDIEWLLIKPDFRNKWYWNSLIHNFIKFCQQNTSFSSIKVETHTHNSANYIYQKNGFKLIKIINNDRENWENTNVYEYRN